MKSITSHSSLHPFGWCVVLLLVSTQSWGQETGCIRGDCIYGQGTYTFANGGQYVGEFANQKRNGQGTYTFADGGQYVGEWRDGLQNGRGTYTREVVGFGIGRRRFLAGIWQDGKFVETFEQARQRELQEEAAREQREQEQSRRDRIYNACILDKSNDVDLSVLLVARAVKETCREISDNPSWLDSLWYD